MRQKLAVRGVVQGVGFRPFVARLADEIGLAGHVGNDETGVFIEAEGNAAQLDALQRRLVDEAPPLATVVDVRVAQVTDRGERDFRIVPSRHVDNAARTLVPPDTAVCDECLAELRDPADRRYRHPFITCTNCGPRFTIITDLPYDRPATTMAGFELCARCREEYDDPADRRHHAQPIGCHDCGPTMWLETPDGTVRGDGAVLAAARSLLADGRIVAIKGIGGFHLACDAENPVAVARLRERKHRPDKPFALMTADPASWVRLDGESAALLASQAHPIVLLSALPADARSSALSGVADGLDELGVMLPYTPLHHLLLEAGPRLLVMTSGNLSDEPLCFDNDDARARLGAIADAFLMHDRPIAVPCEDSVMRVGEPVRRSRGYAPLPVVVDGDGPDVLAVGGEVKNAFCLTRGDLAFVSGHLGDMGSLESRRAFDRSVGQLMRLHEVEPRVVAADDHPGYSTRQWAQSYADEHGLPLVTVQHHHAHVVSLLAEHHSVGTPIVGLAFDGTGYGCDRHVWGGEVLVVGEDVGSFVRAEHLAEFTLAGGDAAVRNPFRIAMALAPGWEPEGIDPAEIAVVRSQLESGVGCAPTSSAGRLFDGVAALLGVRQRVSYEAQAAIELEALARAGREPYPLDFTLSDWAPMVEQVLRAKAAGVPVEDLALGFHHGLAEAAAEAAVAIAARAGIDTVGLTGGVFANRVLAAQLRSRLQRAGLGVLTHRRVPCNDGGLSLGQAVVARARVGERIT